MSIHGVKIRGLLSNTEIVALFTWNFMPHLSVQIFRLFRFCCNLMWSPKFLIGRKSKQSSANNLIETEHILANALSLAFLAKKDYLYNSTPLLINKK